MAALCRRFGISRKTGYKWLERFRAEGEAGLQERSRASQRHPNQTPRVMEEAIIAIRQGRAWGPKKIAAILSKEWPPDMIPALSTIGDILKRNGLVVPRRLRRRCSPSTHPLAHAVECNLVWSADFKGWFLTADGRRVDPLTVTDAHSRYLLGCQVLSGKTDTVHVMAVFETLFRTYGLPERIRTDNGTPFASTGLYGLSRLSVWWMRLGITPERIRPGTPSENGRHERFHLTLKQEAATPPATTPKKQQQAFEHFRAVYNHERPHEALGQVPPATCYTVSPRPYPERLPPVEYDDDMIVRRVRGAGQIKWRGHDVGVSCALTNQPIGLKPCDETMYEVYFGRTCIGIFNERTLKVRALRKHERGRRPQH
jgi:transposase InsO family protein